MYKHIVILSLIVSFATIHDGELIDTTSVSDNSASWADTNYWMDNEASFDGFIVELGDGNTPLSELSPSVNKSGAHRYRVKSRYLSLKSSNLELVLDLW